MFWTSDADIRQLCQCENVAGFYQPRVSGSVAFSGRMRASDRADMGQVVLFHEYAHHFLLGADTYGLTSLQNLDRLPATGATIVVAPLPIVGGTGSPTRVFALVER